MNSISFLEVLSRMSDGRLLAQVLSHLPATDLIKMYVASRHINQVCKRYQMMERLYAGKVFLNNGKVAFRIPGLRSVAVTDQSMHLITDTGDVYAHGQNVWGQLGVGQSPRLDFLPKIKSIAGTNAYTAFVACDGDLRMCGDGEWGVLGDGNLHQHIVSVPSKIWNIPRVKKVACGTLHVGFITYDGDVYMHGDGEDGVLGDGDPSEHYVARTQKVQMIEPAKDIGLGIHHSGVVCVSGSVYMFGHGYSGELGDGNDFDHVRPTPFKIGNIPNMDQIACRSFRTVLLSSTGKVWTFGGCLGHGRGRHKMRCLIPTEIEYLSGVRQIACGSTHTVALTTEGHVYSCGNLQFSFKRLDWVPPIQSIACTDNRFTMVAVSEFNLTLDTSFECT